MYIASAQEYSYTDSNYGKTWMYFPDGDGVPHVIGLNEQNRFRGGPFDNSYSVSDQVNFELYTRLIYQLYLNKRKTCKS